MRMTASLRLHSPLHRNPQSWFGHSNTPASDSQEAESVAWCAPIPRQPTQRLLFSLWVDHRCSNRLTASFSQGRLSLSCCRSFQDTPYASSSWRVPSLWRGVLLKQWKVVSAAYYSTVLRECHPHFPIPRLSSSPCSISLVAPL